MPTLVSSSRKDLKKHKNAIDSICKKIKNEEIYFEHQAHDYWGLYSITILSKNNKIFYDDPLNIEHVTIPYHIAFFKSKKSRRILLDCLIIGLITKTRFNVIFDGNTYTIGINKALLKQYFVHLKLISNESLFIKNQKHILKSYNLILPDIIFADQGEILFTIPNSVTDIIIELSKQYSILLKEHPRIPSANQQLITNLKRIPSEIPLEMLISNNTVVIGIASTFLKFFTSISIINFVTFHNEAVRNTYYNFINSKSVIIPVSIEDFVFVVINHLKKNKK